MGIQNGSIIALYCCRLVGGAFKGNKGTGFMTHAVIDGEKKKRNVGRNWETLSSELVKCWAKWSAVSTERPDGVFLLSFLNGNHPPRRENRCDSHHKQIFKKGRLQAA